MFSTFNCCAFIPLAALKSARIILDLLTLDLGYLFDRFASHVVGNRNRLLHHLELPRYAYQAYGAMRGAYVRCFHFALIDLSFGCILWLLAAYVLVIIVSLLGECTGLLEINQVHLGQCLSILVNAAIGGNLQGHAGFGGFNRLTALIEHRVAVG